MDASTIAPAEVGGFCLIGTYKGVSDGPYPKLVVEFSRKGRDGQAVRVTQDCDFRGYNPQTGEPTQVGAALKDGEVQVGDQVVIGLFQSVFEFVYKADDQHGRWKKGAPGSMVKSEATSLHRFGA
jgi:hypothetical protein